MRDISPRPANPSLDPGPPSLTPDRAAPTTPLPRLPSPWSGPMGRPDAERVTERLPIGHLCGYTGGLPLAPTDDDTGLSHRAFARLLIVGGLIGLLAAVVRAAENAAVVDVVPACATGRSLVCEPLRSSWSPLTSLLGVAGFAILVAVGTVMAAGVTLPRRAGRGLVTVVLVGAVVAHITAVQSLLVEGALCYSCLTACVVAIPLVLYTALHARTAGWLTVPAGLQSTGRVVAEHHRLVVGAWYLAIVALALLANSGLENDPERNESFGAAALISTATVMGAWLATRYAERMGLWLSVASALMMVTALTDIVPDVWAESGEAGTPLWIPGIALVLGFVVVAYFTRGGCGHGHDEPAKPEGDHHEGHDHGHGHHDAPSREGAVAPERSATAGGVGTAAALTVHRVIEGATLALAPSVAVIGALFVHSASEGLALGALFQQTRQRLGPWLLLSVAGPVLGVVVASVSPIPETVAPVLLALVGGVLMRTAWMGLTMVAAEHRRGQLRTWHVVAAVVAAGMLATVTIMSH